ncbi:hypothetical protein AB205_0141270 [Aquarana catesbeiana]|uniref:Uncharacterized protein n=1 Tax=Aquarana catesbeiana TaxID=8400 RepID=A0A2G9Q6R7_AQUCT|nr:hypothetical protein AB205_0141270 [Aquarana catesbeiana]
MVLIQPMHTLILSYLCGFKHHMYYSRSPLHCGVLVCVVRCSSMRSPSQLPGQAPWFTPGFVLSHGPSFGYHNLDAAPAEWIEVHEMQRRAYL